MRFNRLYLGIVFIALATAGCAGNGLPNTSDGGATVNMAIGKTEGHRNLAHYLSLAMKDASQCEATEAEARRSAALQTAANKDKNGNKDKKKGEIVITPAGPMPKGKVHPVRPGETIRRNPDGSYTVVPQKNPKGKSSKHQRGKNRKDKENDNG